MNKVKNLTKTEINKQNLDGNGERIDIYYKRYLNLYTLDMYQKSHYFRYEFAKDFISSGDFCGDFACGTGYGSVMLAEKSQKVIGVDINSTVIDEIKKRYKKIGNVNFINANLLDIEYDSFFDAIVSFETIE